jgi:hypothetical protein
MPQHTLLAGLPAGGMAAGNEMPVCVRHDNECVYLFARCKIEIRLKPYLSDYLFRLAESNCNG